MKLIPTILAALMLLVGCGGANSTAKSGDATVKEAAYKQITQDEAKRLMAEESGYIILDVRTQEEYDAGHIPGAVCIPNEEISGKPPAALTDYDQLILVYCRSGNRSKQASQKLADMGFTCIYEFGGINTWTGEIVTG